MIAEYKLYHGAVLSELVDISEVDLVIGELQEEGRLTSYILNQRIGLHIKHSTSRPPPWQFTITKSNLLELFTLARLYRTVFVALVCGTDGIAVLSLEEVAAIVDTSASEKAWVRVDRSRGQQFSISGNGRALAGKKAEGVATIISTLAARPAPVRPRWLSFEAGYALRWQAMLLSRLGARVARLGELRRNLSQALPQADSPDRPTRRISSA